MILISHRGNINGRLVPFENQPNYIDTAIAAGYDVEIDVWYEVESGKLYLGHDKAEVISCGYIVRIWIHFHILIKSTPLDPNTITSHMIKIWGY
jgi:hypothetical protein